jgi:type IV pilus assembly protein PilW
MKAKEAVLHRRQRGLSLVEIMVALVIGLLAAYAIYVIYEGSEKTKRNMVSMGEAQISGLYSVFLINRSFLNSGGGMLNAAAVLGRCPGGEIDGEGDNATLRPIPVAIDVDNSGNSRVFVSYGTSSLYPVPLDAVLSGGGMNIDAPLGFRAGSILYAIGSDSGGNDACQAIQINGVTMNAGIASVTFDGTTPAVVNQVVDMGHLERQIIFLNGDVLQVDRWGIAHTGILERIRSDPVVSNVVRFYAQYGLDANDDGMIDQWQGVVNNTDEWAWGNITDMAPATIGQIRAVRFGLVVRADEPDRDYEQDFSVRLFEACPPEMTSCPDVSVLVNIVNPDPANGLRWRYRSYETVIPVKNSVWNPNGDLTGEL